MTELILRLLHDSFVGAAVTIAVAVYIMAAGSLHALQKALKIAAFLVRDLRHTLKDIRRAWAELASEVRRLFASGSG